MFTEMSRFILFGKDAVARKPTIASALMGTGQNGIRRMFGLKPLRQHTLFDYGANVAQEWAAKWFGSGPVALPTGWPTPVFSTLDRLVKARGGQSAVGDNLTVPCFSLDRKSALVLPHMWLVNLNVHGDSCDIKKLLSLEEAFEDALARECNQKLNIRILSKPLRIEIDRLTPVTRTLAQRWEELKTLAQPGWYLTGDFWDGSAMQTGFMGLENSNEFSAVFVGGSGSGKTQFMLGALFTVAYNTSPEDLSIIVIDPKSLDFPVEKLPHLALDIINDAEQATKTILSVVAEMDRRVAAKDRAKSNQRILIVIDELADLLSVQEDDTLSNALQRLAQKGRAWGFSLWIGSQRATKDSMPQSVLQNIPCRFVGRVGSAHEAAFSSGKDGCDAHRLPGKGAFQVYCPGIEDGLRIQSLFVADANKPDYEKHVHRFVRDIIQRWAGKKPHWTLRGGNAVGGDIASDVAQSAMIDDSALMNASAVLAALNPSFVSELWDRFGDGDLSQQTAQEIYKSHYGQGASWPRIKRILDAIDAGRATLYADVA